MVLTFDPQGQGQSDTFGESPDQNEGVPAQTDGRPFYDGTEDAINFFLSTPGAPVRAGAELQHGHQPRGQAARRASRPGSTRPTTRSGSCSTRCELGLAGHSYGAAGVSYIAQWDPRVKAVVALGQPRRPRTQRRPVRAAAARPAIGERAARPTRPPDGGPDHQAGPRHLRRLRPAADPEHRAARPATPSRHESLRYSKAGVDSGEIVIRGGSHLDFSWIPNPAFGASLAARTHRLVHHAPGSTSTSSTIPARTMAADRALARRPRRGGDRPQPRRQRVLVLLLLAPRLPPGRRRGVRLRGPAARLPGHGPPATVTAASTTTSRSTRPPTRSPDRRRRCGPRAASPRARPGPRSRSGSRPPGVAGSPACGCTSTVVWS